MPTCPLCHRRQMTPPGLREDVLPVDSTAQAGAPTTRPKPWREGCKQFAHRAPPDAEGRRRVAPIAAVVQGRRCRAGVVKTPFGWARVGGAIARIVARAKGTSAALVAGQEARPKAAPLAGPWWIREGLAPAAARTAGRGGGRGRAAEQSGALVRAHEGASAVHSVTRSGPIAVRNQCSVRSKHGCLWQPPRRPCVITSFAGVCPMVGVSQVRDAEDQARERGGAGQAE